MSSKRRTLSPWWLLGLIPLIALLVPTAMRYAVQFRAAAEIREHLAEMTNEGYPVDIESLQAWFANRSSKEHTVDWGEITVPMSNISQAGFASNVMRWDGQNGEYRTLRKVVTRGDDPLVVSVSKSLSQQAQPIVNRVQALLPAKVPVWLPMDIDVAQPHFVPSAPWNTNELLLSEIAWAIHEGEANRAVELLKLHAEAMAAFDWQTTIQGEQQRATMLQYRNSLLRVSLDEVAFKQNRWTAEQLASLIELLDTDPALQARWRNVIATERAILLEAIGANDVGIVGKVLVENRHDEQKQYEDQPATQLLAWVNEASSVMSLADAGYEGLRMHTRHVGTPLHQRIWFQSQTLAGILINVENSRRLTRAALMIKKFQLDSGDWPAQLSDLPIPSSELMEVDGPPFDYRHEEQGDSLMLRSGHDLVLFR